MSRWAAAAWTAAALLALVGCFALTFLALLPGRPPGALIPVSGGPREMPPTPPAELFPAPASEQNGHPGTPTMVPGLWYRAEMDRRLGSCYEAFHAFYLLEQVAFYEPAMLANEDWLAGAASTLDAFRASCEQLGSLPQPPNSFVEIDGWLKLAAAEVGPAADSFDLVMSGDDRGALLRTIDHLSRFIEYTRQAEEALDSLKERKEI